MLPVEGWKVYTSDAIYTGNAETIPADVQVVIFYHAYPYRTIDCGEDTYEVDGVTLYGKWMELQAYEARLQEAYADMEWPQ